MSFPVTASAALGSSSLAGGKERTFVSLSFFFLNIQFLVYCYSTQQQQEIELRQHRLVLVGNSLNPRIPAGRKIFPVTGQVHPDAVRFQFLILSQWEKPDSR